LATDTVTYLSNGASNPAGINQKIRGRNESFLSKTYLCPKDYIKRIDAPTVNVGGEDDSVARACGAGDVGPEATWDIVDDLAGLGLAAKQRPLRPAVEALQVRLRGSRRRSKHDGKAEENLRRRHGAWRLGVALMLAAAASRRRVC